jgi:non-ribosomal peptide synthase protein (TIGR01720 family)
VEDIEAAYAAAQAGSPVRLPPRTSSFQRWSEALGRYAASPAPAASLPRWLAILAVDGKLPAAGAGTDPEGLARSLTVSLEPDETQALLQRVHSAYRTEINDILLAALALAVRGVTGRDALRVDVEGHGREEWVGSVDLSRTVGWFTSLYPVALEIAGADNEGAALQRVKEVLRQVPDRGLSHGVLRYLSPDQAVRDELAAASPAELLFNYLGQFDRVVAGSKLFTFADEPTGAWHGPTNERTHRLEVVAMVRGGRFEARWTYGVERDRPEAVARLADGFIAALRSLIRHCLSVDAPRYSPSDFPLAELDQPSLDRLLALHRDLENVYPLSPMQRLFLSMESSQAGGANIGFEQWLFCLRGPVNATALREAWEATIAAHDMLRTAFIGDAQRRPLQVVKRSVTLPWTEEDWRGDDAEQARVRLENFLRSDRVRGFDVATPPLCRLTLIQLSAEEYRLVWSTHHLYVDGWSWPLVFRDVGAAYAARLAGRDHVIAAPCQYGAYIAWLAGSAPDSQSFWKERLTGFTAPTPLLFDAASSSTGGDGPAVEALLSLPPEPTAALQALARTRQITQSTVVQGAWALLLGHLSGQHDVVFGAAFSGRPAELSGVESLVGPCVNNLPVRVRLDGEEAAAEMLGRVHADNVEVAHHQHASLPDIQRSAGIPWRLRIFESLVVFQNYVVGDDVRRWGAALVEPLAVPEATNYPLTLTVTPGAELTLKLAARGGRFERASLERMLDGLARVLTAVAERPEARVREILDRLPQTLRGKAVAPAVARSRTGFVAAASEMERKLAEVWQALFDVDRVSVEDNFFDLGGHSMLLLQAHERIGETTGREIPIVALLQYPTVRALARYLSEGATNHVSGVSAADRARLQRQAVARQRDLREKR